MRTVIVVDDEPITRLDISQMLEELGFSVIGESGDGFDAVEACRIHHPDVVLMDVRMPIFDGLNAAQTIIEEDIAGCVVLLTAFSDRELIERAGQVGVTGYLIKPVEQRLILPTIEVAFAQSLRLRESRIESEHAREKLEESKIIARAKGILAEQKGITEMQAYQEIRHMAMNKRCTIASLSTAIVEQSTGLNNVQKHKQILMQLLQINENEAFNKIKNYAEQQNISMDKSAEALILQAKERGNHK